MLWIAVEYGGGNLIAAIGLITIARLLHPADFGVFSIALAVVEVAALFTNMLFHDALIQKREARDVHFDAALTASVIVSVVVYGVLFAGFPLLASIVSDERITVVGRILALGLLVSGPAGIIDARQSREFGFRLLAFRTLSGRASGVGLGILCAVLGWGVWALVVQNLAGVVLSSAALFIYAPAPIRLTADLRPTRDLLGYSVVSVGALTANFVSKRVFVLAVGLFLGTEKAGLFNLAFRLVDSAWSITATGVAQVLLPTLSRLQDDRSRMVKAYRLLLRVTTATLFPVFTALGILAPYLVQIIFGSRWEGASFYMLVLSLLTFVQIPRLPAIPLLSNTGHLRDICITNAVVLGYMVGAIALTHLSTDRTTLAVWCGGEILTSLSLAAILHWRIGVSALQQLKDVLAPLAASICMILAFQIAREALPVALAPSETLLVVGAFGAVGYVAIMLLFGRNWVEPLMGVAQTILAKEP